MTLGQTEYRSKIRREMSRDAIALAMENRWEEASVVNSSILELFPNDLEAHNRLGKACFELGTYQKARDAFNGALRLSPSNTIAKRNLDRLNLLKKKEQPPKGRRKLPPQHFLEESGKTAITSLEDPIGKEVLAKLAAGDAVSLRIAEYKLIVESLDGEYLGQVPRRLALRLVRLLEGGNKYESAVARLDGNEITIMIREMFQHPDQRGMTSFPSRRDRSLPYPRSALLDFDFSLEREEDEDTEETFSMDWDDNEESVNLYPRRSSAEYPLNEDDDD
jgi:tetratricopeptide (TPR) repeat protein